MRRSSFKCGGNPAQEPHRYGGWMKRGMNTDLRARESNSDLSHKKRLHIPGRRATPHAYPAVRRAVNTNHRVIV